MTVPFRYRRLVYAALNVTDIERSLAFYRDMIGLDPTETEDDYVALRCSRDHHNLLLYRSEVPGLKRISFEVESAEDLEAAREHIASLGLGIDEVSPDELDKLKLGSAFRFREPNSGVQIELCFEVMHMGTPFQRRLAKIIRIGHVVLNAKHWRETVEFFSEALGFATSDYNPGYAAFMRCYPNPLHHTLAIVSADRNGLHHVNFMVEDIDDIGCAYHRIRNADVEVVFGPGRHQPSQSIFLYFLDPDRLTLEYSYGMELLPEEDARGPRMLEPTLQTLDSWGGAPAPGFGATGEIEG